MVFVSRFWGAGSSSFLVEEDRILVLLKVFFLGLLKGTCLFFSKVLKQIQEEEEDLIVPLDFSEEDF